MTKYGRSPWIDQFPKSRVPALPRQRGPLKSDVVDHRRRADRLRDGVRVRRRRRQGGARWKPRRSAAATAGRPAGWISEDPGIAFADLEKALGLRGARRAWQGWRRAALDFAALLRRLDVKCDLDARPAVTVAVTPDQAGAPHARAAGAAQSGPRRAAPQGVARSGASSGWTRPRACARKTARRSIRIAPASGSPRRRRSAAPRCSSAHRCRR